MLVQFCNFEDYFVRPISYVVSNETLGDNILTIVNIFTRMASSVPTSWGPLFGSYILNSNGASLSNTTVWPSDKDGSISSIAEKSNAFNTDY